MPKNLNSLLTAKPKARFWDVETDLFNFSIITFAVDPNELAKHLHSRFAPFTLCLNGQTRSLVSVVPFEDSRFHISGFPWMKFSFGQTNYRAYVIDSETGDDCVWFFGTSLGSFTNFIPRYLWQLPWHHGVVRFDCLFDFESMRYSHYRVNTRSQWAPFDIELKDSCKAANSLQGFDKLDTGLAILTHPMKGYYFRRDNRLGGYSIWHDRLELTQGHLEKGHFPLLEGLGLITDNTSQLHSVLIQRSTSFQIRLPPMLF